MTVPSKGGVPRARRPRGETRARVVEACTELIRAEGTASLTTERVAREVGISQPGFYKHFDSLDALVLEGVGVVLEQGRSILRGIRVAALARFVTPQMLLSRDAVEPPVEATLKVFVHDPRFAELFLRYRDDPTLFDGSVVELDQRIRQELSEDCWVVAQRLGARPEDYARVAVYAEHMLALFYVGCEQLLHQRFSLQLVVSSTSSALVALNRGLLEDLARAMGGNEAMVRLIRTLD